MLEPADPPLAPTAAPPPRGPSPWARRLVDGLLAAMALTVLAAKLQLDRRLNINWDEFNYLSLVHTHLRDELTRPLQVFHVHLFGWLSSIGPTEVDQVLAARTVGLLLLIGVAICVYLVGERLVGRTGALIAVIAALSFSLVLRHGGAFRSDTTISLGFMLAATLLIRWPGCWRAAAVAGLAMGLTSMFSIKAVIYAPSLAVILGAQWLVSDRTRRHTRRVLVFAGVAAISALLLYLFHRATLAPESTRTGIKVFGVAWHHLILLSKPFPQWETLLVSLRWDLGWWVMLAFGTLLAFSDLRYGRGEERLRAALLLAMGMPLLWLVVYRNAWGYFYVTIVPAASVLIGALGAAVSRLGEPREGPRDEAPHGPPRRLRRVVPLVLVVVMTGPLIGQAARFHRFNSVDRIKPQRLVLEAVHAVFPEPAAYFDRCSMVSTFPRIGLFMSTNTMKRYRRARKARVPALVKDEQPKFVLNNNGALDLSRPWAKVRPKTYRYLKKDHAFMRKHFVRHWGPLWVAGKALGKLSGSKPKAFNVVIEGDHVIEAKGAISIDGKPLQPRDVVALNAGRHTVQSLSGTQKVTLRHADAKARPKGRPPRGRLFDDLKFRRK